MQRDEHSDGISNRKNRRFKFSQRPRVSSADILLNALKPFESIEFQDDEYDNPAIILGKLLTTLSISSSEMQDLHKIQTLVFKVDGEWQTQPNSSEILAASVHQLIVCLLSPDSSVNFQKNFLLSSPSFVNPRFLLAAIYQRYFTDISLPGCNVKDNDEIKNIIRPRAVNVIKFWLKQCPYQFDKEMVKSLNIFLEALNHDKAMENLAKNVSTALNEFNGIKTNTTKTTIREPPPLNIPSTPPETWTLQQIEPHELARQITIFHSHIFHNITPLELLAALWGNSECGGCPNIIRLQEHFDLLSRFISHSIIFPATPKERANEFKRWFEVGQQFEAQLNFNGLFSVICGITHRSVVRMEQTMKIAYKSINKKELDALTDLCEIAQDFKNYRQRLQNTTDHCVPFIGCFQKDLVYIQESYPNKINDLINFKKCSESYKLIERIAMFQNQDYCFFINDTIQRLVENIPPCGDTLELITLSKEREPTQPHK
ncbi:RasGEF domain containing protein [Trichomonas vaginalis G3]|uniref:RasGEF domain containing protein n=1 Tax=Trichomonas vaginalis (strain ATCC PRA-98 / G3) TaxID=412133 RepID=A2DMC1_TRIV3|nr:guanyl-nucleotide exchange factor protein [Trichomonas vaginalis G3]EAY18541.1 RasGEF domain containing protein [Trichomonas vaginalis G3]KAI5489469.1 guanyl-nucleotide exchange factor protein [Trichomonas vaginalis G3]|eukprot:XP_001579527.1 RasGEF domain containing protein [Trichomonas vaginalis G3]